MATMMFAISNAVYYGMSFIYTPIFTRMLTMEEMGTVTMYGTWSNLLMMLCTFSVWGCAYNGFVDFKGRENSFLASLLLLANALSAAEVVLFAVLPDTVAGWLGLPKLLVAFMLVNILLMPAYQLWCAKQRYAYRWKAMFLFSLGNALSTLVVGVGSVKAFPAFRAEAKVIGSGVVQVIIYAVMYVLLLRRGGIHPEKGQWKYALRICAPLLPGTLATSILGQSDRVMIDKMLGKAPAAVYGMAGNISTIAYTVITSSINVSWVPYIFQKMESHEYEKLRTTSRFLVGLVGLGCLMLTLCAPELLEILAPDTYDMAKWCVPALLMGILYEFTSWLFTNIESYYRRTEFIAAGTLTAAGVNILLNWLLIPRFGFVAAAYTTWFSAILMLGLHSVFFRKVCAQQGLTVKLYDLRAVGITVALFTAAAFGGMALYPFFIIRAIIVAVICIAVLANIKKLLARLKAIR